ncbi:hypothetical protein CDAR_270081 [Caerostris darwini]|uniref:Uncharacterized protein n=1 Tax=Caerostris darwini TaxID=1538125 RepID=A0AAV4RLH1_9ARAC|nr:hypothetical protein CDAR_270081 [Caerostris darwini]
MRRYSAVKLETEIVHPEHALSAYEKCMPIHHEAYSTLAWLFYPTPCLTGRKDPVFSNPPHSPVHHRNNIENNVLSENILDIPPVLCPLPADSPYIL